MYVTLTFDQLVLDTHAIHIVAKDVLKVRLQWIISSCPRANPSRTTLKRVNDFLLSPLSGSTVLSASDSQGSTPELGE